MINLKQLVERYKDEPNGLGYISWKGKSYYEINSDKPLRISSYGGSDGFVLNDNSEVKLWDSNEKVFVKRHYYSDENWDNKVEYETEHFWDEEDYKTWWGKTLNHYYPHPYYPEKKITDFELVRDIPFFRKGTIFYVNSGEIQLELGVNRYSVENCLMYPEFFRPIYEN